MTSARGEEHSSVSRAFQGSSEPVAVVGIGCRYPGVRGPQHLWSFLLDGRSTVGEVPPDRWDRAAIYDLEKPIPTRGGFLPEIRAFDAQFFGIAPREAEQMDPQQRMLLEVVWEALEDAGQDARKLSGTDVGVYIGAIWHDYEILHSKQNASHTPHSAVGQAIDVIAARVSYALGVHGPAMVINTACSSSLVALHLACNAIRSGECESAIVGGTNIMLVPDVMVGLTRFGGLAPDGVSKAFSARANGFGRGEGVGVVFLKPLGKALADGDRIYCTVRATGINNDGGGRQLTSPSADGQIRLLRQVYTRAGVDPQSVYYMEAHGTGTPAGDPTEATALGTVLGRGRSPDRKLLIGSVKTNIGHQEGGAGVAGLIKVALSLFNGKIPRSLHADELNPEIDFDGLGLSVLRREGSWDDCPGPRVAGVSSFGWGGTNAHAIVEAAPPRAESAQPARSELEPVILLSAASRWSLEQRAADLAGKLSAEPEQLGAICATLAKRRAQLAHRLALSAATPEALVRALERFGRGETLESLPGVIAATGEAAGAPRRIVFVFPGQGSQWLAMGRALMGRVPAFRASVLACENALNEFVDWSLSSVLSDPENQGWLERVDIIQCALWAMQFALAELWRSLGVLPDAVVGHSMGEVAAACFSGGISLRDGARVIATRSRLARRRSGAGRMLHVALSKEQAAAAIRGFEHLVSVAVCSSPKSSVLSGDARTIEELERSLNSREVFCRQVRVDYASHSPQMDDLLPELLQLLTPVEPLRGAIPMFSTMLGRVVSDRELGARYWADNLRNPVLFAERVEELARAEHTVWLEVSPHPVLVPSIEETLDVIGIQGRVLGTLRRDQGGLGDVLARFADLHAAGARLDARASALFPGTRAVDLPLYPWEWKELWLEPALKTASARAGAKHALIRGSLPIAGSRGLLTVLAQVSLRELPFLQDHVVEDTAVFPGAGFVDLVLSAAREVLPNRAWAIHGLAIGAALALGSDIPRELQVVIEGAVGTGRSFTISSRAAATVDARSEEAWIEHARGMLVPEDSHFGETPDVPAGLTPIEAAAWYDSLRAAGLHYGAGFQGIESLRAGDGVAAGFVRAPAPVRDQLRLYSIHPAQLDSVLQLALAAIVQRTGGPTYVPVHFRRVRSFGPWPEGVRVLALRRSPDGQPPELDIWVSNENGEAVGLIEGLELHALSRLSSEPWHRERWLLASDWTPTPLAQTQHSEAGTFGLIDFGTAGKKLATALESLGHRVERAPFAPAIGGSARSEAGTDFTDARTTETWIEGLGSASSPLKGVVIVADTSATVEPDWERVRAAVVSVARVAESLAGARSATRRRLVILTTGAVHGTNPAWAALWGAGRVVDVEHPDLGCLRVDWDGEANTLGNIVHEISCESAENELSYRDSQRFVNRLTHAGPSSERRLLAAREVRIPAASGPFRLEELAPGSPSGVEFCASEYGELAPDRVRVALRFACQPIARSLAHAPGLRECSGRVLAIGADVVGDLAVGDEVFVITDGGMASHADAPPDHVIKKAAALGADPVLGSLLPLSTAWYALHELARISEEDTILIVSGAGELGMSAVQVARRAGLEIFATAENETERQRLLESGVDHVFEAESADLGERVRRATGGRGVDVVFDPSGGKRRETALEVLAGSGRLVQVGADEEQAQAVFLAHRLRRGISFFAIDVTAAYRERRVLFSRVLDEVLRGLECGALAPLPVRIVPASALQSSRDPQELEQTPLVRVLDLAVLESVARSPFPGGAARGSGLYLITGGLGALGLAAAEWLVDRGARKLALLGRGGPNFEAQQRVERLRNRGVSVRVLACDVGVWSEIAEVFRVLSSEGESVRGVLHAAGVLDDATLANLEPAQVERVFRPKALGAYHLHRLTAELPLDFFVLYSSVASLLGSAGQAAYCAANASVDALARHRRQRGLPALALNLGPVSDVGLAAVSSVRGDRLTARGLAALSSAEIVRALDHVLSDGFSEVGVARFDAGKWREAYPAIAGLGRWSSLLSTAVESATGSELCVRLKAAAPENRLPILKARIRSLLAAVLRYSEERIASAAPFGTLGLDSLLGLELRGRLSRELGIELPATVFWRFPSIDKLAPELLERAALPAPRPQPDVALPAPDDLVTSTGAELLSELEDELRLVESLS